MVYDRDGVVRCSECSRWIYSPEYRNDGCPYCHIASLRAELSAVKDTLIETQAALDKADMALCRAREALGSLPQSPDKFNSLALDILAHRIVGVEKALSSPDPCRHEEENK